MNRFLTAGQEGVNLFGNRFSLFNQVHLVDGQQLLFTHEPLAFNHHIGHIRCFTGIDNLRVDIFWITFEMRLVVNRCQVNQNQVCAFAFFQATGYFTDMQCFRTDAGDHFQNLSCRQDGRVTSHWLSNQTRQAHFFKHIKIIIGGSSIGANANFKAHVHHLGDWRETRSQLEV